MVVGAGLLACLVVSAPVVPLAGAVAQDEGRRGVNPNTAKVETADVSDDSADQPRDPPTAEDILKALQRQRPVNEVIPPVGAGDDWGKSEPRLLLPEGAAVVNRPGRLSGQEPWWVFVPDASTGEDPIKLLPNANLESMVRTAGGTPAGTRFIVSGETTVFRDENYLFVRFVRRALDAGGESPAQAAVEGDAGEKTDLTRSGEEPVAGDEKPKVQEPTEPQAEDVLKLLQQQRPAEQMMPPTPSMADSAPARKAALATGLRPEGMPLVNRPGRLVRHDDWWSFAFESDHPDHPEPPMRLLPNQSVELMVDASQGGSQRLVFVVSGETTVFQGENYLLPAAAMMRVATSNLRP